MNKSEGKKRKINYKTCSLVSLAIGLVLGVVLISFGAITVHNHNDKIGDKDPSEISKEISELAEQELAISQEMQTELDENGHSDKYFDLVEEYTELRKEITKITNSRELQEEGKHKTESLSDVVSVAPMVLIGAVVIVIGFVGFFILRAQE